MVLTITLNPLLEKKMYFTSIGSSSARAYKQEFLAGGKGINVSRQLNYLGIKNHALTFLGGANGKKYRHIIESEGISFSAISTKSETREASLIYDDKSQSLRTYFGTNSEVTNSEVDQFVTKMEKAISNSSIVVFSGSLPSVNASKIIEHGIKYCNENDKISVLDSYGEKLIDQINEEPTIIHNNQNEISESFNQTIKSEEDVRKVLNILYSKNIKLAFVTDGKKPTYASKADFHYRIENPEIQEVDSTGSGDAFVSGIIYGLEKSLIFNDFIKLASSLGIQNALSRSTCKVSLADSKKYVDQINVVEIGKKIKIIDDSPTI